MKEPSRNRSGLAVVCAASLLGAVFLIGVARAADITDENVVEHIASAKTAADHQAIAQYFHAQAKVQADRVKMHEEMLAGYKKIGGKPYQRMIDHCQAIIAATRKLQKDYEAMAADHEKMAKK